MYFDESTGEIECLKQNNRDPSNYGLEMYLNDTSNNGWASGWDGNSVLIDNLTKDQNGQPHMPTGTYIRRINSSALASRSKFNSYVAATTNSPNGETRCILMNCQATSMTDVQSMIDANATLCPIFRLEEDIFVTNGLANNLFVPGWLGTPLTLAGVDAASNADVVASLCFNLAVGYLSVLDIYGPYALTQNSVKAHSPPTSRRRRDSVWGMEPLPGTEAPVQLRA